VNDVIPKEPALLPAARWSRTEPAPKSAEELLAELTKKVEERNPTPEPAAPPAPGPAAPIVGGPGVFDPVFSPWVARVKLAVRANWSGAQLCKVPFNPRRQRRPTAREVVRDRYCDESASARSASRIRCRRRPAGRWPSSSA
jgi:hypothetical protein